MPTQTRINREKYTFCDIKLLEHIENVKTGRVSYLGLELTMHIHAKSISWDNLFKLFVVQLRLHVYNYLQFFLYPPIIIRLATALFLVGCDGNIPVDSEVDELVGHIYAEAILVPLRDHYVEFVGEWVRVPVHH